MPMSNLDATLLVTRLAEEGEEELKAFAALTRGDDGIKGLKREDFGREYAQLLQSPLLRRLKTRVAREDDFRFKLAELVMAIDCPEAAAPDIAKALAEARENPRKVPFCLGLIPEYLAGAALEACEELERYARRLWPDVWPIDPNVSEDLISAIKATDG